MQGEKNDLQIPVITSQVIYCSAKNKRDAFNNSVKPFTGFKVSEGVMTAHKLKSACSQRWSSTCFFSLASGLYSRTPEGIAAAKNSSEQSKYVQDL